MRARNIKPSIFKNELLARLGPWHHILFTGLWCLADRKGRLEDRPDRIEAELFPFKFQKVEINQLLNDLAGSDAKTRFILRYKIKQHRYIQIINFEKHQYPNIKEQESTIPAPYKHGAKTIPALLNPSLLNPSVLNTGGRGKKPPPAFSAWLQKVKGLPASERLQNKDQYISELVAFNLPFKYQDELIEKFFGREKINGTDGSQGAFNDSDFARRTREAQGLRKADFQGQAGKILGGIRDMPVHEK